MALPILTTMSAPTGEPILADLDKIWIFVAIAIGSIIVEWLKKKNQPGETDSTTDDAESRQPTISTTSRPTGTRPSSTSDWEEELRRLLGGEPPVAKPPVPRSQPTPVPPPIQPIVIQAPSPVAGHPPVTDAPQAIQSVPPRLARTAMLEAEKMVEIQLPTLKESGKVYQRASHLQEQVVERLKHVEEMTTRHLARVPTAHRSTVSPDAIQTIALIRNRNTVRQAIIAGLILGTPKGLENE